MTTFKFNISLKGVFSCSAFLLSVCVHGQAGSVSGNIYDKGGKPIPFVVVSMEDLSISTSSNFDGAFTLSSIPEGAHTLSFEAMGYKPQYKEVSIIANKTVEVKISLFETQIAIDELVIEGKSKAEKIEEQGYSVNTIDAEPYKNTTADINQVLNQSTGVNVRQSGGLGSDFVFSINGLSGKQVKFFIDGVPMDLFGSSYTLNNIPVNLIKSIEVYKGVVPVYLGADALGGAVNITTNQYEHNFADLSYSYGSFNTHRAALNTRYTEDSSGFTVGAAAFYNYSDNNYKVDVRVPDPLSGKEGPLETVTRFHDAYRSAMIQLEAGVRDKSYANYLLAGIGLASNKKEVQHGASMDEVFGEVTTSGKTFLPFVKYKKRDIFLEGLTFSLYSSYTKSDEAVTDTASRSYNWYGDSTPNNDPNIGEASWNKSLFTFKDEAVLLNSNLDYQFKKYHQVTFNYTQSFFSRQGTDPLDQYVVAYENPNLLNKKVLGLSYNVFLFKEKLSATVFSKYYLFSSKVVEVYYSNPVELHNDKTRKPGYGFAASYKLFPMLQVSTSFESAYRLPEGYEMFGNGLLLLPNATLEPEHSNNFNVGAAFKNTSEDHRLTLGVNYFSRISDNLIRIQATGIESQYVNLRSASCSGFETEAKYTFHNWATIGFNGTYQNIINTTALENGHKSQVYLDRIPNIPYLFGNAFVSLTFKNMLKADDKIQVGWTGRYVERYYLKWPSQGASDAKHIIPRQYTQDLQVTYSFPNNRFNISAQCQNILNAKVYDHFRIQKPGRAFYVKIRYFINKS